MTDITTEVVVIGAGQAGIATSEHLTKAKVDHVVLERDEIASRWRKERWDSLVANGPAWHDRFPNLEFEGDQERFVPKEEVADYMRTYVEKFNLPVNEGIEVTKVIRNSDKRGFTVETTKDTFKCDYIVAATGAFQVPVIPAVVPESDGVHQLHSSDYHNPQQLPAGGILVVGAGSSGVQIADELAEAGREVYLAVGPHDRPPRSYRNRDFVYWLGVLDMWDMVTPAAGAEHVTISVTGAKGGYTVDFRDLSAKGIHLTGRAGPYEDGVMHFANDLQRNIEAGDRNYLDMLEAADKYVEANGLDLPKEPEAHNLKPLSDAIIHPPKKLNLKESGVNTVLWATGFARDYHWLDVHDATDSTGAPIHQRGVSEAHGVYFVGLPWQSRRGSSFIWGCWHDAKYVVDQINIQRNYRDYNHPND